jgi:hypothetical protein
MDSFLWWSGAVAWGALGVAGFLGISDKIIEYTVNSLWTQREFLAFVADRLKRSRI